MKTSPKVLFITRHYPFPETTGAYKYSASIINRILLHSSEITLLAAFRTDRAGSIAERVNLTEYCLKEFRPIRMVANTLPICARRLYANSGCLLLKRLLLSTKFTHIFIDHISCSWALKLVSEYSKLEGAKVVYVSHNEEVSTRASIAQHTSGLSMLKNRLDKLFAMRTQKKMLETCDLITAVSNSDLQSFLSMNNCEGKVVLMRPVSTITSQPSDEIHHEDFSKASFTIGLLGSFLWSAKKINLENFLNAAYDKLAKEGIKIRVIGNMRSHYMQYLQNKWPLIELTGPKENISCDLKKISIGLVVESAGGGFKLKYLDYIFSFVPIFTIRSAIPFGDINLVNQHNCMIYDSIEKLVDGCIKAVCNVAELNRMARNAYDDNLFLSNLELDTEPLRQIFNV